MIVKVIVTTELELDEPTVDAGFITWMDIEIRADEYENEEGEEPKPVDAYIGRGSVALIHVGGAGEDLWDALDADSGEMEALHNVYFEDGWFKDEYAEGAGSGLLYVSEISIEPAWQGRNIELAVVRRLCETVGQGCELAVIPYESAKEIEHWGQMGFEVSTPKKSTGYMHMKLAYRLPRIVRSDDQDRYNVVPDLSPDQRRRYH